MPVATVCLLMPATLAACRPLTRTSTGWAAQACRETDLAALLAHVAWSGDIQRTSVADPPTTTPVDGDAHAAPRLLTKCIDQGELEFPVMPDPACREAARMRSIVAGASGLQAGGHTRVTRQRCAGALPLSHRSVQGTCSCERRQPSARLRFHPAPRSRASTCETQSPSSPPH